MTQNSRLAGLRRKLYEKGIEALLVSRLENRLYISGFDGSSGFLLITGKSAVLATDFRFVEQAQNQSPGFEIFQTKGELSGWFPNLPGLCGIKTLGFEADNITFDTHRRLADAIKESGHSLEFMPVSGTVESLRMIKDPGEIRLISKAVSISDAAMDEIAPRIRPGMTEVEAAWLIEEHIRTGGSQPLPFEIILASGPNAALPHASPSGRPIGHGEPVVIDIGAKFEGYASDITRTISAGTADKKFKEIYSIVFEAQQAAINGIAACMTGAQADMLARRVIADAGFGDNFGHGLGHGVGLAVHEKPALNSRSEDVLSDGMVFTIEPGIYIPEWGGIRIEDTVVMEHGKIRVLSQAVKMKGTV